MRIFIVFILLSVTTSCKFVGETDALTIVQSQTSFINKLFSSPEPLESFTNGLTGSVIAYPAQAGNYVIVCIGVSAGGVDLPVAMIYNHDSGTVVTASESIASDTATATTKVKCSINSSGLGAITFLQGDKTFVNIFENGAWTGDEELYPATSSEPNVTVMEDGTIIVATVTGGNTEARVRSGGSFAASQVISAGVGGFGAFAKINDSEVFHISRSTYVMWNKYSGGSWSGTNNLTGTNVNPSKMDIASRGNNHAVVAFVGEDATIDSAYGITYINGEWKTATVLESSTDVVSNVTTAINSNGDAVITYVHSTGGINSVSSSVYTSTNDTWTNHGLVEDEDTYAASVNGVDIDGQGNVMVVGYYDTGGFVLQPLYNRYTPASGWEGKSSFTDVGTIPTTSYAPFSPRFFPNDEAIIYALTLDGSIINAHYNIYR